MHEGLNFIRKLHSESVGPAVIISGFATVATVFLLILYFAVGEVIADWLYRAQMWPSVAEEFSKNGATPSLDYYETAIERTLYYLLLVSGLSVLASLSFSPYLTYDRLVDGQAGRLYSPAFRDACMLVWLLVIALAFRLPGLNLGIWRDEASTYFEAASGSGAAVVGMVKCGELNPPGFYLITHYVTGWIGTGEHALKISPFVFGLLAIPASYFLARTSGSRSAALLAAAFVTISPVSIYYAQEARPNTLAALLCCLVTLFFLKSLKSKHRVWSLFGFVLSASLLIYVQYTGLMLLVSLAVVTVVLIIRHPGEVPVLPYLISGFAIFAVYIPWIPVFFDHLGTGTPWTPEAEWSDQPRAVYKNIAYLLPWSSEKSIIAKATLGFGTIALVCAIGWSVSAIFRRRRKFKATPEEETATFVLGVALLGPILMLAVLSLTGRYMFSFIPIVSAFLGIWLVRVGRLLDERGWRWLQSLPLVIVAFFVWTFFNVWDTATSDRLPKSGIPAVANSIDLASNETLYLLNPDFMGPTFGYYTRDKNVHFIGFARLEDPHIFRPLDYADIWSREHAVEETIDYLRKVSAEGYSQLALIEGGSCKELKDKGQMQYSRVYDLREEIDRVLSPQKVTKYPARIECVTVTEYSLTDFNAGESAEVIE